MRNETYGFAWNIPEGVAPGLVSAIVRTQTKPKIDANLLQPCWVFDYSISAFGLFRIGGRRKPWQARNARVGHLYAPNTRYAEDLRSAQPPIQDAWILFNNGEAAGLQKFVSKNQPMARFLDPKGLLQHVIMEAADTGRRAGQAGFWKAQARLCELLSHLHQSRRKNNEPNTYEIAPRDSSGSETAFATVVRRHLQCHLSEPGTLSDMASALGISVSALCHKFRAETGVSPMAERMRMRLAMAQSLLLKGRPLKSVAEDTGFCDPYHLSKAFKRFLGLSPRAFIKAMANGNSTHGISFDATRAGS